MGQDPDEIREEIERTRAEMGQTVDAIGYKADVPARAREKVSGTVDSVKAKVGDTATRAKEAVTGTTSQVGDRVNDATPSRGQVKRTARRAVGLAQENPLGLAVGAVALGFLGGLAAPSTRVENQRLGRVADQVKDRVKETGQEVLERGKDVVQQTAQSAVDTAKEQGQQHGQAVTQHARESARDMRRSRAASPAAPIEHGEDR
jgi:gas vesicle protein